MDKCRTLLLYKISQHDTALVRRNLFGISLVNEFKAFFVRVNNSIRFNMDAQLRVAVSQKLHLRQDLHH